jgi:hypothetical protein
MIPLAPIRAALIEFIFAKFDTIFSLPQFLPSVSQTASKRTTLLDPPSGTDSQTLHDTASVSHDSGEL